jgi:TetR/AcrR family transcriptional regulator, mexJK operon transcriptional repressor
MSGAGGRPTKAQAAAKNEELLDTARRLFCERGFAGTSIDEIAATLSWSKHTVYNRHASKIELLEAVVDRDVVRFVAALEEAKGDGDGPLASLRAMAWVYFDFATSPGYSALYAAVALEASSSEHLSRKLMEWAGTSLAPLRAGISDAADACGWKLEDIDEACGVLIDLLDGEANRVKWGGAVNDRAEIGRRFERRWEMFQRAWGMCPSTVR